MFRKLGEWLSPSPSRIAVGHFLKVLVIVLFVASLAALSGGTLLTHFIHKSNQYLAAVLPATIVDLTNTERKANGTGVLSVNLKLEEAARLKAQDMAKRGYFSHVSPEGVQPWYWLGLVQYKYYAAGENLAVHFDESSAVNAAWMASPSHRANILNREFTEIGVGTAVGLFEGRSTIFVVQYFGRPISAGPLSKSRTKTQEVLGGTAVMPALTATTSLKSQPIALVQGEEIIVPVADDDATALPVITIAEPFDGRSGDQSHMSASRRLASDPLRVFGIAIAFLAALIAVPLALFAHRHTHHHRIAHVGAGFFMLIIAVGIYVLLRFPTLSSGRTSPAAAVVEIVE